ncbi:MAG TPA: TonB family protein [Saprospiraceae bacterium]|nr:TonB family protein [Saprospiraceae bacterium]
MKLIFQIICSILLVLNNLKGQPSLRGFTVQDMNGKTLNIEDVTKHDTDKILVLYTWFASHCLPCMKIMDYYLNENHDEQQKKYGIKFVALNINKSDIATAKKAINGDLKFQLKRAHHFCDVEGNYMRINNINTAPELFIIVNGQVVHHEKGFYTKMGDVKNNANHIKDVIDAFSSNVRLFDQFGKICKEKKNAISPDNLKPIPTTKMVISKSGDIYKIAKSNADGKLLSVGYSPNAFGSVYSGKFVKYYDDGKTSNEIIQYNQNGEMDTLSIFHKNGNIFTKRSYKENKLWNVLLLKNKSGEDLDLGNFKDGIGILNAYDFDKLLLVEQVSYNNGILNGSAYKFSNGIKSDSVYFVDGIQARFPRKREVINDIDNMNKVATDENEIFKVVEMMPRFPGCEGITGTIKEKEQCAQVKMLEYIYQNLKYPQLARENGVEGTVVLHFVIAKDGYIDDIKIVRDIGAGCGDAAASAVDSMNDMNERWIPGTQRGRKVRVLYTLPVKFKLEG